VTDTRDKVERQSSNNNQLQFRVQKSLPFAVGAGPRFRRIETYVVGKALDGLFVRARVNQEKKIRTDSRGAGPPDLLKKVVRPSRGRRTGPPVSQPCFSSRPGAARLVLSPSANSSIIFS
jgi:hypothetical protein